MSEEVFVEAATILLTAEQREWVNAQANGNGNDRGAAIRALIDEQIRNEKLYAQFVMDVPFLARPFPEDAQ